MANEKWYIYYSFLDPATAKFERIRIYEGINEYKELDVKEKYAREIEREVNKRLDNGYDPYEVEAIANHVSYEIKAARHLEENPKSPLLLDGFKEFLKTRAERILLSVPSKHTKYIGKFEYYLYENRLADVRLDQIDSKFIATMLDWLKPVQTWNGTTYNNHLNFWVTLLNWFARKPRFWVKREEFDFGTDGELEHKVTKVMKNQYFGDTKAEAVKEKMKAYPKLLFFS